MGHLSGIVQVTGVDWDLVAQHFEVTRDQVGRWMVDESTIPVAHLVSLMEQFDEATEYLDERHLTWDQVFTFRQVAKKLGVSHYTLSFMLARRDIEPMDFGCLGLWITAGELAACRH